MKLPSISYDSGKNQQETVALRGLNWSDRLQDGGLSDSRNVSARRWPYLTTRKARAKQEEYNGVTALAAYGKLAAVRGTDLLYDGQVVGQVTPGEKQFAAVNTKLVIWPDKVYLDLESQTVKPLEAKMVFSPKSVSFEKGTIRTDIRPVMIEGRTTEKDDNDEYYQNGPGFEIFAGINLNLNSKTYYFRRCKGIDRTASGWALTDEETVKINQLKIGDLVRLQSWSEDSSSLASVWGNDSNWGFDGTCYAVIKEISATVSYSSTFCITYDVIYCPLKNSGKIEESFKAGDAVTISGAGDNDKESAIIREVTETTLTFDADIFPTEGQVEGVVTLERRVPDFVFICESQNRLWGCEGHTICASALGDPTNFYVFDGLSTDSYAVAVGSDGDFTGCIGYSEGVLFWKSDCLHKVLGTYPANYELHTYSIPGVQAGSEKSMTIINDVLFYKGDRGIYTYTGGAPSLLSACFGNREFSEAVGGSDGEKYYLSMLEGTQRRFLGYDPATDTWLQEDDTGVKDFARLENRLYFADDGGNVWMVEGGGDDPEMEWMAQFTPFYETIQGRKRYSKLLLRMELPQGSWLIAEIRRDNGAWRECGKVVGRKSDVIPLRLPLGRCDKFELRLRGKGPCTVLSILREFTVGSFV